MKVLARQTDGLLFALETEVTGTNTMTIGEVPASGRTFVLRGVSVGGVSKERLVCEQRHYWDLGSFLMQVGAHTPPVWAPSERSQADGPESAWATVRARIPKVARSAPSEMTGKIAAFFHSGSMDDQS